MKTNMKVMLAVLALGASALVISAQDSETTSDKPDCQRPPPSPIIGALDANHDHVIDADEIANASAVLKSLDKNGDGVLTPDEFAGKPPQPADGASEDNRPPGPPPSDE